ncbi:hypothetical protein Tco_1129280 [Tanacetum coccineum]
MERRGEDNQTKVGFSGALDEGPFMSLKLEKSHGTPLALVANTGSSLQYKPSYFYETTSYVCGVDYDEDYQQDDNAPNGLEMFKGDLFASPYFRAILQQFNATTAVEKGHYDRNFVKAKGFRGLMMEEIKELSVNICLMARIQPADHTSDDEPSCESAFINEVQSSSIDEKLMKQMEVLIVASVEKDTPHVLI